MRIKRFNIIVILFSILLITMNHKAYGEDDFSMESFLKSSISNQITELYFSNDLNKYLSHFEYVISPLILKKIPSDFTKIVDIKVSRYHKNSGNTEVRILYQNDDKIAEHKVMVRTKAMFNIPVLDQRHKKHQIINSEHIEYKKFPLNRLRKGIIFDAAELIDKQTNRSITSGSPIQRQHIMQPYLVKKNEIISIIYNNQFMKLKTSGLAMDNGSKGERIRIKNMQSGKIIAGTIIGKSTVSASNTGV